MGLTYGVTLSPFGKLRFRFAKSRRSGVACSLGKLRKKDPLRRRLPVRLLDLLSQAMPLVSQLQELRARVFAGGLLSLTQHVPGPCAIISRAAGADFLTLRHALRLSDAALMRKPLNRFLIC